MRFLPILFAIIICFGACRDEATSALRSSKAARELLGSQNQKQARWQLALLYDPYDGGTVYAADSLNPTYLILGRDGRFATYDTLNFSQGRWYLNREKQKMAFEYEIQNGIEVPPEEQSRTFSHLVLQATEDTLRLGLQGRHGMVEYTYVPIPPDSLSSSNNTDTGSSSPAAHSKE